MPKFTSKLLLLLLLIFSSNTFYAQQEEVLPAGLTETEKGLISGFQFKSFSSVATPPAGPVRTMAEWEEVEYLVIRWTPSFQNILRQIVEVGVNECKIIIVTQNQSSVAAYLSGFGIDLANITFLNVPSVD